ncbi:MAG: hypothetical protein WCY84_00330 [Candidatus Cloacimonadaceae bacterium]
MILYIRRGDQQLAQISDIIELTLDPLSFCGVDYWSQEARCLKITLPFSGILKRIIERDLRMVKAGFHCFWAHLVDNAGNTLYIGVLKDGDFSVSYLSLTYQTIELEFTDYLGLILSLAADRLITLSQSTLSPISYIPQLISEVINPAGFEPETELYRNADILELAQNLLLPNLSITENYDPSLWQPYRIERYLLLDAKDLINVGHGFFVTDLRFGFSQDGDQVYLILWLYAYKVMEQETLLFLTRFQKYRLQNYSLELISSQDIDTPQDCPMIPKPSVSLHISHGDADYSIQGNKAYYSGPASIEDIAIVPGDYKADALLSELLRITNAVLSFHPSMPAVLNIKNRLDSKLFTLDFVDPVEVEISQADSTLPSTNALAIAHQSALDLISDHYQKLLNTYPYQIQLVTHLYAPDYIRLALSSPYELIQHQLRFDDYNIIPHEIDYDPVSLNITISGRGQYARQYTHHSDTL